MVDAADKTKRPASQYYWGDWFKDLALQSCSQPARGLWHEMNCLMHQGEPYGHLTMPNGKPMQPAQLANLCKIAPTLCTRLLQELEDNGVFSRTEHGTIFSRRMVRDEAVREARANGGKAGSEHGIKGAQHGGKGGRPAKDKGGSETPLPVSRKPPPSSSSSSSSSPSVEKKPSASSPAKLPTCPVDDVIDLYHEVLPEMPRAKLKTADRLRAIRKTWAWLFTEPKASDKLPRATTAAEALDWLRGYFGKARDSDFLMGRTPRVGEHANWKCDLDFLLTDRGMKHVIEKT